MDRTLTGLHDSPQLDDNSTYPSWDILFPGLSEARALRAVEVLMDARVVTVAEPLSPYEFFGLSLDRVTAQWLRAALSGDPSQVSDLHSGSDITITRDQAIAGLGTLVQDLDDFLERSD